MIIINILDILKRYTDENHRLSQKQIADILKKEYERYKGYNLNSAESSIINEIYNQYKGTTFE